MNKLTNCFSAYSDGQKTKKQFQIFKQNFVLKNILLGEKLLLVILILGRKNIYREKKIIIEISRFINFKNSFMIIEFILKVTTSQVLFLASKYIFYLALVTFTIHYFKI